MENERERTIDVDHGRRRAADGWAVVDDVVVDGRDGDYFAGLRVTFHRASGRWRRSPLHSVSWVQENQLAIFFLTFPTKCAKKMLFFLSFFFH